MREVATGVLDPDYWRGMVDNRDVYLQDIRRGLHRGIPSALAGTAGDIQQAAQQSNLGLAAQGLFSATGNTPRFNLLGPSLMTRDEAADRFVDMGVIPQATGRTGERIAEGALSDLLLGVGIDGRRYIARGAGDLLSAGKNTGARALDALGEYQWLDKGNPLQVVPPSQRGAVTLFDQGGGSPPREITDMGFYSPLKEALQEADLTEGTEEEWQEYIKRWNATPKLDKDKRVKKEELEYLTKNIFATPDRISDKKVTREELIEKIPKDLKLTDVVLREEGVHQDQPRINRPSFGRHPRNVMTGRLMSLVDEDFIEEVSAYEAEDGSIRYGDNVRIVPIDEVDDFGETGRDYIRNDVELKVKDLNSTIAFNQASVWNTDDNEAQGRSEQMLFDQLPKSSPSGAELRALDPNDPFPMEVGVVSEDFIKEYVAAQQGANAGNAIGAYSTARTTKEEAELFNNIAKDYETQLKQMLQDWHESRWGDQDSEYTVYESYLMNVPEQADRFIRGNEIRGYALNVGERQDPLLYNSSPERGGFDREQDYREGSGNSFQEASVRAISDLGIKARDGKAVWPSSRYEGEESADNILNYREILVKEPDQDIAPQRSYTHWGRAGHAEGTIGHTRVTDRWINRPNTQRPQDADRALFVEELQVDPAQSKGQQDEVKEWDTPYTRSKSESARLMVKRMLVEAERNGHDSVMFANAEDVADLWGSAEGNTQFYKNTLPDIVGKMIRELDPKQWERKKTQIKGDKGKSRDTFGTERVDIYKGQTSIEKELPSEEITRRDRLITDAEEDLEGSFADAGFNREPEVYGESSYTWEEEAELRNLRENMNAEFDKDWYRKRIVIEMTPELKQRVKEGLKMFGVSAATAVGTGVLSGQQQEQPNILSP